MVFWSERSACDQGSKLRTATIAKLGPRRDCHRVPKFCMGSLLIKAKILVNLFFDPGPLVAIFIFFKGFLSTFLKVLFRHVRRKISASVDGGPSGGSRVPIDQNPYFWQM